MRKITITIEDGDETRTFEVVQTIKGGMVMEGETPACLCCIGEQEAGLIESAIKYLGLKYLLWSKGWDSQWDRRFKSRWNVNTQHKFVEGVETPDGWIKGVKENVDAFKSAERPLLESCG
jgi:hypothetical protein